MGPSAKFRATHILASVSLAAVAFAASPAFADDAVATGASSAAASGSDIIVTARRKEESLQSVPVSITALSQKDLTERSVTSAADLAKLATGLVVAADSGNPSVITFSIRGRGQVYGAATGSVETYFADVPLSSTFQMPAPPPQFFDLSSFQILKGPQGTLFGRNTTGGAVVIVPQAPKLGVTEGYLRVQGGTYDDFQAEAAVNLPLGEKAALRVAAFDWQRKGYVTSSATDSVTHLTQTDVTSGLPIGAQRFNNADTTQLRASLLVKPTDGIENTTVVSYIIDKTRAASSVSLVRTSPTTAVLAPTCGIYCAYIDVSLNKPASHYLMVDNTTKIDLSDSLKLKNILGYTDASAYGNVATNAVGSSNVVVPAAGGILQKLTDNHLGTTYGVYIDLPLIARAQKNQQFTDELQLQGTGLNNKLSYTIGGMYDQTSQPHGANDINIYSASYSGLLTNFANAVNFESTEVTSKALYASGTFSAIENLNITAGFRETWVDLTQYGSQDSYGVPGFGIYAPPISVPSGPIGVLHGSFKGSTYNLGVDYHLDNKTMVYGGYRHGWKRGGINPAGASTFAPEMVDDFSLGVKSKFKLGDMPVRVNVELFYDPYTGMQVSSLGVSNAQLVTSTINVPKTRYQGFDADIWTQPAAWLDLSGSWSHNDAKFTRWTDPLFAGNNLAVNQVPAVSKDRLSGNVRLHGDLPGKIGEVVWLTSYNYQSKSYTLPGNTSLGLLTEGLFLNANPIPNQPISMKDICAGGVCGNTLAAYSTVDMRVELNHAFGSRFDLAASVTNLTNKFYLLGSSGTLDLGAEGFAVGAPRMWTFEVRTKF